jgi:dihydroxyacetone kinase-like predicted kinase
VLLEALTASFRGEPITPASPTIDARADLAALHDEDDTYGYCTEVLFEGEDIDLEVVRRRLMALGTSVLVVGDPFLLKIHVHTTQPGQVLDIATEHGQIVNVKVDNIQRQRQALAAKLAAAPSAPTPPEPGTAVVAVAAGQGFAEIFTSLGAIVVDGGDSMNPSVQEILDAIKRAPRTDVIVLPNDSNAVLASEAAARLPEGRTTRVVPTRSMAQGIAATLSLTPSASADANLPQVGEAAARCHTIALARAAKDAIVDNVQVSAGRIFGLLDGRGIGAGATPVEVLRHAIDALPAGSYEIATVYVGARGAAETAAGLAAVLTDRLSAAAEIESGGQPHYEYIISIE